MDGIIHNGWALDPWARPRCLHPSYVLFRYPTPVNVYDGFKIGKHKWSNSKRSWLVFHLQSRCMDIYCLQEIQIDSTLHEDSFSAYFYGRLRGVTWLVSRCLNVTCSLVPLDLADRLGMLDANIKDNFCRILCTQCRQWAPWIFFGISSHSWRF